MPTEDAARLSSRYREDNREIFEPPRSLLLDYSAIIPTSGLALDIAMGLGNNANFLHKHGLQVIGVDISLVAIRKVKRKFPNLMAVVADLNHFYIPNNKFDEIICFLYLQRDLWMAMTQGVKLGGVIFIECLTDEMISIHPEINREFLIRTGELQRWIFSGVTGKSLEIIDCYEGWRSPGLSHTRAVASLIARRVA